MRIEMWTLAAALTALLVSASACDGCNPATPPEGTVPEGGDCEESRDCADNLTCSPVEAICAEVGCEVHDDCGPGAVCNDDGSCATNTAGGPCDVDDNCVDDERCLGGRCDTIAEEGEPCAGAAECEGALVCAPASGECEENVSCADHSDCGDEAYCRDDGTCAKSETESPCEVDATCPASDRCFAGVCIPDQCQAENFVAEAVEPNMLIVLDRSGSMDQRIGGFGSERKWNIALDAVDTLTAQYNGRIRFGLYLFPGTDQACNQGAQCQPGVAAVNIDDDTGGDINAYLADTGTCLFGTPMAATLDDVLNYTPLEDPTRPNYVLLITDGEENCDADPADPIGDLLSSTPSVQTYVVGFGGGVDPGQLNDMAQAGGTALPGNPSYYQADDATSLDTALAEIGGAVLGCDYVIPEAVPNPDELFVFFDGIRVERDTTGAGGWDYTAATSSLSFAGNACTALRTGNVESLILVYGCPGQLPPPQDAGPDPQNDGGTPPPVDAGGGNPGDECTGRCDATCAPQACLVDEPGGAVCGACSDDNDCCPGSICIVQEGTCLPIGG
jgi:hypothetical protein